MMRRKGVKMKQVAKRGFFHRKGRVGMKKRRSKTGSVLLFLLIFLLAAFIVFTAVSALGGRLAHWFNSSPRGQMLMHRVAGLVFVALAGMLIFSCVA